MEASGSNRSKNKKSFFYQKLWSGSIPLSPPFVVLTTQNYLFFWRRPWCTVYINVSLYIVFIWIAHSAYKQVQKDIQMRFYNKMIFLDFLNLYPGTEEHNRNRNFMNCLIKLCRISLYFFSGELYRLFCPSVHPFLRIYVCISNFFNTFLI